MAQINVEVEQATAEAAREAAGHAGMLLRKWVERAILKAANEERPESVRVQEPAR